MEILISIGQIRRNFPIKILWLTIAFFGVLSAWNRVDAQTIIRLEDYGVKANSHKNAVEGIEAALKEAAKHENSIVQFPGGRIDLWPEGAIKKEYYISNATESDSLSKVKYVGILLEGMKNVILDGNGTLVVSHGKMVHLAIDNSSNITVKNLAFDYERPTMSEFRVETVGDDFVVVKVNPDSKYRIESEKVIWYGEGWRSEQLHVIRFEPKTETMYYEKSGFMGKSTAKDLGEGRILFKGFDFKNSLLKEGDVLTFRDSYRDCVGVLNNYSQDLHFENLDFHYLHGLGMVSQFSKNIHVNGLQARPRESTQRVIAGFADFLHFSGCYGEVKIENSLFSGSHDDPVNIHGTHLRVVGNTRNQIKVKFMHHQTWNLRAFEPGDSIGFVDNQTLSVYDFAVVKEVVTSSPTEMELTLDRQVPSRLVEKHCIENITKTPTVLIRNNRFEHTNTRGLLVTTRRKTVIENNVFFRTGMHAILIANDCNFWYESGPVRDVTIRNNKFIECGYNSFPESYAIAIKPEVLTFVPGEYVHSNIRILDNEFYLSRGAMISAVSTDGLTIEGNLIRNGDLEENNSAEAPLVFLKYCRNVKMGSNDLERYRGNKDLLLREMTEDALILDESQGFIERREKIAP